MSSSTWLERGPGRAPRSFLPSLVTRQERSLRRVVIVVVDVIIDVFIVRTLIRVHMLDMHTRAGVLPQLSCSARISRLA